MSKTQKNEVVVETNTNVEVESAESIIARYGNKSKAIRGLHSEGKSRSDISKMLGLRYQHVRNVLVQPLKKVDEAQTETTDQE